MYKNSKIFNTFLFSTCLMILSVFGEAIGFPKDAVSVFAIADIRETNEREEEENVKYVQETSEKIKQTGAGGSDFEEKEFVFIEPQVEKLYQLPSFVQVYIQEHFSLKEYTNNLINSLFFPKLYILFHCPKTYLS